MKKNCRRILIVLLSIILAAGIGFKVYVSNYYHADDNAKKLLQQEDITEEGIGAHEYWNVLKNENSEKGFIFYPGAKVEEDAYLPLMQKLQKAGYQCYLVHMPFNMAIFHQNIADEVIRIYPEIKTWYIGGHSMGGAFASSYAARHQDKIKGLVLLGAYRYGDYPVEKTLTIYGSEDKVLNRSKITDTENVFVIEGGNHAGFGNYGIQRGDGSAKISEEEQQDQTIKIIREFLK